MSLTLFIVGAGASKEIGLPIGSELTAQVASLLDLQFRHGTQTNGDSQIGWAIRDQSHGAFQIAPDALAHAGRQISQRIKLATSIDRYIDDHNNSEIAICGKLAIARAILNGEEKSALRLTAGRERSLQWGNSNSAWLRRFFNLLIDGGCRFVDLTERLKQYAFICFNYDRCIEHYLFYAIKEYYRVGDGAAAGVLGALNIFHPYGTVGQLPWQAENLDVSVEFGAELEPGQLAKISSTIKTFTEREHDFAVLERIRSLVYQCEKLVFLGFGYDTRNLELLEVEMRGVRKHIFATALGFSIDDVDVIEQRMNIMIGEGSNSILRVHSELGCAGLMDHYRLHLASSLFMPDE